MGKYLRKAFTCTYSTYVCYVAYSLGAEGSFFLAIALSINLQWALFSFLGGL